MPLGELKQVINISETFKEEFVKRKQPQLDHQLLYYPLTSLSVCIVIRSTYRECSKLYNNESSRVALVKAVLTGKALINISLLK